MRKPNDERLVFGDITIPLKVIVTNLDSGRPEIFSKETASSLPISDAVRASLGIPFIFYPHTLGSSPLVHGGLIWNYPAGVFDLERERLGRSYPPLGFRVVEDARTG